VQWGDRNFYNVIVTVPGDSSESIVIADHYDVADKEPIRPRNLPQLRRDHGLTAGEIAAHLGALPIGAPVPGADDNASATAALLEIGALLGQKLREGIRLRKTIRIVHLVGEEMPADCLGGRAFVRWAREHEEPILGAIVLDMIGVDRRRTRKVQISVGEHPQSLTLAAVVKASIHALGLDLRPVLRPFGSRRSFLHQTDGIEFSKAGIPVILLNEHMNELHDFYRVGYHDEFDIPELLDYSFATDVTRAVYETAMRLADPYVP
jgi:Zn-dependent M28 family amino/carboxypeptidase